MLGTMMEVPLLLSRLIDHAAEYHGTTEVVGRRLSGAIERDTWAGMQRRSRRLAKALSANSYQVGDCIGSLAWNTLNHLELYYGALGIGVGLHTLNPRLTVDDLCYMIDKVGEKLIFIDQGTLPLATQIAARMTDLRWVYMDEDESVPHSDIAGLLSKSQYVHDHDHHFEWPEFDERQAATICFTSGTTGRPKGVVYSHRSITLGAMNMSMADMYATYTPGLREVVMPIAGIFHANGWMMPFSAPMNGHKLVLPGRAFDPASTIELIRGEGVTTVGAVPTVWQDLVQMLRSHGLDVPTLRTGLLAGTRPSAALYEQMTELGVAIQQSWGMTEVPGAARASPPPGSDAADQATWATLRRDRQGRIGFMTQMKIVDDAGVQQPCDGKTAGYLRVRGPTVAGGYLGDAPGSASAWLDTGDIAVIYPDGTLEIVDRAKDVIKSGGEWISTLQLESAAMSHPAIESAAAISVPHPRWQERPLLLCVLAPGQGVHPDALREHMQQAVAKWWLPDEIVFIERMPLTGTGKIDKMALRRAHTP